MSTPQSMFHLACTHEELLQAVLVDAVKLTYAQTPSEWNNLNSYPRLLQDYRMMRTMKFIVGLSRVNSAFRQWSKKHMQTCIGVLGTLLYGKPSAEFCYVRMVAHKRKFLQSLFKLSLRGETLGYDVRLIRRNASHSSSGGGIKKKPLYKVIAGNHVGRKWNPRKISLILDD